MQFATIKKIKIPFYAFGFLGEFWDSITSATEGTVAFFQNIGLAVAGALGNIFQGIVDIGISVAYAGTIIRQIFGLLMLPVQYVFFYLQQLFTLVFDSSITDQIQVGFSNEVLNFITSTPFYTPVMAVLFAVVSFYVGMSILHSLRNI